MDAWVFWVILAVILAAGEVVSLSFFLAPFAVGAVAAALLDAAGVGAIGQFAAFLASSLLLIGIVRPIGGEVWTARAYDDGSSYEAGSRVHVMEIRGATALVTEI